MDKPLNSPFSQPMWHSPQIFSSIYGFWPAHRVQRSTIAWNMARTHEKQSGCFSVYLSLKTKYDNLGLGLRYATINVCLLPQSWQRSLLHSMVTLICGITWVCYLYSLAKNDGTLWLFKKTNSFAGQVEGGTLRRMWSHLKGKPGQGPRPEELCWSNQSCRQREGTSFKVCFIECHKKWSRWIVPLGNRLEDLDINLNPPHDVHKHVTLHLLRKC